MDVLQRSKELLSAVLGRYGNGDVQLDVTLIHVLVVRQGLAGTFARKKAEVRLLCACCLIGFKSGSRRLSPARIVRSPVSVVMWQCSSVGQCTGPYYRCNIGALSLSQYSR